MKKTSQLLFAFLFLLVCQSYGQQTSSKDTTQKKGWTASDRNEFVTSCIKSASPSLGQDSASHYCHCMLEKFQVKFPSADDVAKLTQEDLGSPEFVNLAKECLAGTWNNKDRQDFLSQCVTTAKKKMTDDKAKNYCECMLFKLEQQYPDATKASELTQEKLNSPEWKKFVQGCLNF